MTMQELNELLKTMPAVQRLEVARQLGPETAEKAAKIRRAQAGRGISELEKDYALQLEAQRRAGEIVTYAFHPEPLLLADRCTYQPDYAVVLPEGAVRFDEVKGPYEWRDSIEKFKFAAAKYPTCRFRMVKRIDGAWKVVREYPKKPRSKP